jgi:hypothetical protein
MLLASARSRFKPASGAELKKEFLARKIMPEGKNPKGKQFF